LLCSYRCLFLKHATDTCEHGLCEMGIAMRGGDHEMLLSRVARLVRDTGQQKRTAGDGFQARLRFCEPHEQRPPVIDQGHRQSIEATAFQILGREAAPAPLVLELDSP
jgi:hypothetical protein